MKKCAVILMTCALVISFVAPSFAEMPKQVEKLGRGFANMLSAPLEIGKQITTEWRGTDKKQFGFVGGLMKGLGYTIKRFSSGVIDVLTFPIQLKDTYDPLMKPEYVFD